MSPAGRIAVASVFVLSQLTACSRSADPMGAAVPSGESLDRSGAGPSRASALSRGLASHPRRETSTTTAPRQDENSSKPGRMSGGKPADRPDPLATGSSVVLDAAPDAAGDPAPPYAEIVRASIRGQGDVATFVLEMEGPIPAQVGDRDNLIAGIGIEYAGRMGAIALTVQGTRDGWVAGIHREREYRELEKGWRISGKRFVWTLPWSDVGGARTFRWGASLRWFHFGSDDPHQAEQSQDRVPESDPAVYPASK